MVSGPCNCKQEALSRHSCLCKYDTCAISPTLMVRAPEMGFTVYHWPSRNTYSTTCKPRMNRMKHMVELLQFSECARAPMTLISVMHGMHVCSRAKWHAWSNRCAFHAHHHHKMRKPYADGNHHCVFQVLPIRSDPMRSCKKIRCRCHTPAGPACCPAPALSGTPRPCGERCQDCPLLRQVQWAAGTYTHIHTHILDAIPVSTHMRDTLRPQYTLQQCC